jgi:hypothetical protein
MVQISKTLRVSAEALKARATSTTYKQNKNKFDRDGMRQFGGMLTRHFNANDFKAHGGKKAYNKIHQDLCEYKCITDKGHISLPNINSFLEL